MRHLSPRDLADALGISESSLKRWVDAGKINAFRTEGGHRRIALSEAVRFVRETHAPLARPELLGLAEVASAQRSMLGGGQQLRDFLFEGDVAGSRGFLLARYLAGATVAELADGEIRSAMTAVGELWRHEARGIFIEHRATDTCLQAIAHLRNMLDTPENAPLAVGAAPEDDPYMLPAFLAAMVTTVAGLRTVNLGPATPLSALEHAVAHHRPRLVWMSASTPMNSARARSISRYLDSLDSTMVVVGGRHGRALVGRSRKVRYLDSMQELASAATKLVA